MLVDILLLNLLRPFELVSMHVLCKRWNMSLH